MNLRKTVAVGVAMAAASGAGCHSTPERPKGWNVVLVSVDTLRADHLSCYGSKSGTPQIDRIAEDGILFETVTSVAPTTLPAHASLMTALTPIEHGVRDNVGFYLPEKMDTLAVRLSAAGYRTGAFVGSFVLDARFGLDRGFDVYDDDFESAADELPGGWVAQRPGDEVLARTFAWVDSEPHRGRPFFAFVHFYDPHTPYGAGGYRGDVAIVDGLVGELLDGLEERGLDDDTVLVLTSDHGESLGEHGELTHGFFVYESTLRIPLLMRYPGGPRGERVPGLARLHDVAPTILHLLGVPSMEGVEGESLLPSGDGQERPAYAETFVPRLGYGWSELRSLRRGDKKLVLAPRPELYDLGADPGETTDLVDREPELARRLRAELERRIEGDGAASPQEPDAEVRRKLEALGYVAGSSPSPALADPKDQLDVYRLLNEPSLREVEGPGLERALADLSEALERAPHAARAYLLYGELSLKAGRPIDAERAFSKLVALDRNSYDGHLGLGIAHRRLGADGEAVAAFERAIAIDPRSTKAYFQLSEVERARGRPEAAELWLRRAIDVSDDRILLERLAEALLASGKRSEARALIEELRKTVGERANAWYNLGQLFASDGQSEHALGAFQRAAELAPGDADVQFALGGALRAAGRLQESAGAYQKAASLSSCFAAAYGNLGSALAELGSLDEAVASFRRAVACAPDYALAYKNLAAVELQRGNLRAAVAALESAVGANPHDEELRSTLAQLRSTSR